MERPMADETRTPQTEPAEGSREVIEHELERQSGTSKGEGGSGADQAKGSPAATGDRKKDRTESRH